jgi:hypothetical protein
MPGGVNVGIAGGGPNGSNPRLTISVSVAGLAGSGVDLMPALATACATTPQAFAAAMVGHTGSRSLLTVCQQTNPSISADRLVAALLAPVQSALDGLIRSGAINSAQESDDLANVRAQLAHLVTAGIGIGGSGPAPNLPQP